MLFRNNNTYIASERGYVAIIAAVIVTAIILAVAIVFSSSNFLGRFDTFFLESKDIARKVAEGCLNYARLKLASNPYYAGNESLNIGTYVCSILAVESQGNNKIIRTKATINNRTTNVRLIVDGNLKIVSIDELSSF